jgi:predicted GNAT family N-acyltransferase
MYYIESFSTTDKEKAAIAFNIRKKVFVEEQHVDQREEYDAFEDEAVHYLLYKDDIAIGTARWRTTDKGIKLERFAILPLFRRGGAGAELVTRVLNDVLVFHKPVYLHAQVAAINLYLRAGFKVEGDLFYEAGIPHFKMKYARQAGR